jgi:hypothetical protein
MNPLYYQLMVHICVGGTPLFLLNILTHYHSKWPPRRTRHSSYRPDNLRHVARGISGVICAKAAVIFCRRSASFCGLCPYTSDLTYPHTKKSGGVKSGEFMGHEPGPSRPHQWMFHASSKNTRDFRGLWITTCRMSSSLFLSRSLPPVWGIVRPFSRNMLHHFIMSRSEGTWWQLYWRRKARWVLVTLENFAYHTMHCAPWYGVTAMFVSYALAPPRGWSFPLIFKQTGQGYVH